MDPYTRWTRHLRTRGITVVAPSSRVPLDVHALAAGGVLHFRCRGTAMTLRRWAEADVRVAVPVAHDAPPEAALPGDRWLSLAAGRPLLGPARPGRLVVLPGRTPVGWAVLDGRERFGWQGYDAARAGLDVAAAVFEELLAELRRGAVAVAA